jgi:hypothetical protein
MYPIPPRLGTLEVASPIIGLTNPAIVRNNVVFPDPEGPIIDIISLE